VKSEELKVKSEKTEPVFVMPGLSLNFFLFTVHYSLFTVL